MLQLRYCTIMEMLHTATMPKLHARVRKPSVWHTSWQQQQ